MNTQAIYAPNSSGKMLDWVRYWDYLYNTIISVKSKDLYIVSKVYILHNLEIATYFFAFILSNSDYHWHYKQSKTYH